MKNRLFFCTLPLVLMATTSYAQSLYVTTDHTVANGNPLSSGRYNNVNVGRDSNFNFYAGVLADVIGGNFFQLSSHSSSQLSVSGGSHTVVMGNNNSQVRVTGGTLSTVAGNDFALLSIQGGSVGTADAWGASRFSISSAVGVGKTHQAARMDLFAGSILGTVTTQDTSSVWVGGGLVNAGYLEVSTLTSQNSSKVNITDGATTTLNSYNTSLVTMSHGAVYNLNLYDSSTASLSGGYVQAFDSYNTSKATFTGGLFPRTYAHNSSTLDVRGGNLQDLQIFDSSVLTLSEGTLGSALLHDTSHAELVSGSSEGIAAFDSSTATMKGGFSGYLGANNTSQVSLEGGTVEMVDGLGSGTVTISGGDCSLVRAFETSNIFVTGGTIATISGSDSASVLISGGSVNEIYAAGSSLFSIAGGVLGKNTLHLFENSVFYITGTDLGITEEGAGSDDFGTYMSYLLTGQLPDGNRIDGVRVRDYDDGGYRIGNPAGSSHLYFNRTAAIVGASSAAPEPSAWVLVLLGTLPLMLLRRVRQSSPSETWGESMRWL